MDQELQKQVLRVARNVRRRCPFGHNIGCCYRASEKIAERIRKIPKLKCKMLSGYYHRASETSGHYWIEVWEHGKPATRLIVDVTVDQFANKHRKCKSGRRIPAVIFAPRSDWPEYCEKRP